MVRLKVFGALGVVDDAGAEVATQPRRLALLALLAAAGPRGLTRAKLQAYLWPESSTEAARHALDQLLYYLRRQAGSDAFLGPDPLRLNPAVITSDAGDFEQALARGALAEAVAVYQGPLLDGFYLSNAPEFERWTEEERSRLQRAYQQALFRLAQQEDEDGRHIASIDCWRKLVASDPLSPRAALGLMRALVVAGERPEATSYARSYAALVAEDGGGQVSPDVSAYIAELRAAPPQAARPSGRAPVGSPLDPSPTQVGEHGLRSGVGNEPRLPPPPTRGNRVRGSRQLLALGVALGIAVTLSALASLGLRLTGASSLDSNRVAVVPFDVLGPGLDLWREGIVDLLSRGLEGAGPLRTVAPSVVIRQWHGRADQPSSAELARRTGAGFAVYGSLLRTGGDSARLSATLLDVQADRAVAEIELRGALDRMDRLVDSLAVRVLGELGRAGSVSLTRPARAASLPALKAFLHGEHHFRRMAWDSARAHFERAVAMDSTFALALRHLGWVLRWTSSAEDSLVRVYAFRTAAFNRGLTPRESLLVVADSLDAALWLPPSLERSVPAGDVQSPAFDGQYLHGVKVDFLRTARREIAILKQAVARYPDDPEAWYQLGEALFHVGPKAGVTLEDQRKAFDHAIALDPGFLEPEPHAISLAIQFGDTALGRQYASAYLARNPGVDQGAGVRIVNALLTLPPLDSASLARWADSVRDERALERAREALGRWADPAETGLRLIESTIAPAGRLRDPSDVPRLAHWLASRGHVRAAAAMLGRESSAGRPHLYVDLALLGAVPAETAAATLKGWQSDELLSSLSLPWWAAQGDTATLVRLARRADSTSRIEDQAPWEQDQRRYLAEAARAYLALARHDTAEAVRRFPTLPDSLCLECDFDRLQTAMLLAAAKRGGEAYERLQLVFPAGDLKEPPRPSETLWVLERGKVAEGLGDRATAARAYSWVAGIWRNADPELRPYVREARAGLERLARRQTR